MAGVEKIRTRCVRWAVTFGGIGFSPLAPGTLGSLAGLLLYLFLPEKLFPGLLAVLIAAGYALCAPAQSAFGEKDPQRFVLDEVCGMMLSLLWIPKDAPVLLGVFLLFRSLDILKPWPICLLQKSKRPSAIMHDDLAAALLTNLIGQIILRLVI